MNLNMTPDIHDRMQVRDGTESGRAAKLDVNISVLTRVMLYLDEAALVTVLLTVIRPAA